MSKPFHISVQKVNAPQKLGETAVSFSIKLPDGFVPGNTSDSANQNIIFGLQGFNLSFQDQNNHSIYKTQILPSCQISSKKLSDNSVEYTANVTVNFSLDEDEDKDKNVKHGECISTSSYINLVIIFMASEVDSDSGKINYKLLQSSSKTAGENSYFVSCPEMNNVLTTVSGWDIQTTKNNSKKLTIWNFQSGQPSYQQSKEGYQVTGAGTDLNTQGKNDDFDSTGIITFMGTNQDNFDFQTAWAQDEKTSLTFPKEIDQVFTFVRNLTNTGDGKSNANAVKSFTCAELDAKVNLKDKKVIDLDWPQKNRSQWSDGAAGSWDSSVDYICFVTYVKKLL